MVYSSWHRQQTNAALGAITKQVTDDRALPVVQNQSKKESWVGMDGWRQKDKADKQMQQQAPLPTSCMLILPAHPCCHV